MTGGDERYAYLLRHAKSSWDDPSLEDHERPLARRGIRAAETMREHLAGLEPRPDLVVCSSSLRTRQTLELIRPGLPEGVQEVVEPTVYEAQASDLLRVLRAVPADTTAVLLIGHNPGLDDLANGLAGGGEPAALQRLARKLPTGGLVTLVFDGTWPDLDWRGARLTAFVSPSQLG